MDDDRIIQTIRLLLAIAIVTIGIIYIGKVKIGRKRGSDEDEMGSRSIHTLRRLQATYGLWLKNIPDMPYLDEPRFTVISNSKL